MIIRCLQEYINRPASSSMIFQCPFLPHTASYVQHFPCKGTWSTNTFNLAEAQRRRDLRGRNPIKISLRCRLWCRNDGHWGQNEGTKWSERKASVGPRGSLWRGGKGRLYPHGNLHIISLAKAPNPEGSRRAAMCAHFRGLSSREPTLRIE